MTHRSSVAALALLTVAPSCYSIATVRLGGLDENGKSVKGLPFFLQRRVTRQVTEYTSTWREVQLELHSYDNSSPRKKLGTTSLLAVVDDSEQRRQAYAHLLDSFKDQSSKNAAHVRAFAELAGIAAPITPTRVLTGNYLETAVEVDYSTPYFIDVRAPWAGSAKFEPTLAANGTLSKVSVESTSRVDELVSSIASPDGLLGTVLGSVGAASVEQEVSRLEAQGLVVTTLSETVRGYRDVYTLEYSKGSAPSGPLRPLWEPSRSTSKDANSTSGDPTVRNPTQPDSRTISHRRMPLESPASKGSEGKSADEDGKLDRIGISGTVTVPKR